MAEQGLELEPTNHKGCDLPLCRVGMSQRWKEALDRHWAQSSGQNRSTASRFGKILTGGFTVLVCHLGGCGVCSDPAMPSGGLEWGDGVDVGLVGLEPSGERMLLVLV